MFKIKFFMVIVCMVLFLSCSPSIYSVKTNTGDEYLSNSKPKYLEEEGMYKFNTIQKEKILLNKDNIKEIKETGD